MRVFELAKKLGMTSKALQEELAKMGVPVKNHMSALTDADTEKVLSKFKAEPTPSAAKGAKAPKTARVAKPKRARSAAAVPEKESAPPKRTHLLIKKRAVVPEEAEPVGPSAEAGAPEADQSAPTEVAPPVTAAPVSAQDVRGAAPVAKEEVQKEPEPQPTAAAEPITGIAGIEKKEAPPKFKEKEKEKERVKKARKPKAAEAAKTFDFKQELSKMQDFRPFHRRDDRRGGGMRRSHGGTAAADVTKPRKKEIKLSPGLTVKDFAELLGQRPTAVIGKLMEKGIMSTINQPIDLQMAASISGDYGVPAEVVAEQTEEELIPEVVDTPESKELRPPVVTIMGHVDHGKTSLLDAIRLTRVTETEAGGITQHIGAYMVKAGDKRITFLDTPGHEAFTAMRARGAQVTDIVVLVVAADDGVMPQTLEAIDHAKAANVPIIVAVNKIDKPEANVERVKGALADHSLIPEEWGGQTIFVEVSAKNRINLDQLLEMILLQAEVLELKANPKREARGVIIEAKLDKGRGPVATVLVQEGTLQVGDVFISGIYSGRVRAMVDHRAKRLESAVPSTPVEVVGLEGIPQAGDSFIVVKDERVAKDIANTRSQKQRLAEIAQVQRVSLDDVFRRIQEGTVKELNLILKADVQGSIEALRDSVDKVKSEEVKVKNIHMGVGGITESDVLLAAASNAIIIGFNVRPDVKAQAVAEREKVDIRLYTVIYDAVADIRAAMEGLLEPTLKEKPLGRAEVRQIFNIPKVGVVAGCFVSDGVVSRSAAGARLIRDNVVVHEGKLGSLKRFKDDVKEVQSGYECGISLENFNDIKPGDVIEAYIIEKIAAKL